MSKKYMKCRRGISAYHHFRLTKDDPGAVYVNKSISDPEERLYLVKRGQGSLIGHQLMRVYHQCCQLVDSPDSDTMICRPKYCGM